MAIILNNTEYLSPKESAKLIDCSKGYLKNQRLNNNISFLKYKNMFVYPKHEVQNLKPKKIQKLSTKKINLELKQRNIEIIEKFENLDQKILIKCLKCNYIDKKNAHYIIYNSGYNCPNCKLEKEKEITIEKLKKFGFDLKKDHKFKGKNKKNKLKCINCGYIWDISPKRILSDKRRCPNCSTREAKFRSKFFSKLKKLNIILLTKYKNSGTPVQLKCQNCNTFMSSCPDNFMRQEQGCYHCIRTISIDDCRKRLSGKNIEVLDYFSFSSKAKVKCLKCGYIWRTIPDKLYRISGCPICNSKKNEKLTFKYLKQLLPETKIYHQFKLKIQNKKFIVDFKFNFNKKTYYLEYNGQQHYEPIDFFGGKKSFEKQQHRDQSLRIFCKKNNIILIEIDGRKYKDELIYNYIKKYFCL